MSPHSTRRQSAQQDCPLFQIAEGADTGIYRIVHRRSGKCYVGSASNTIKGRWATHVSRLKAGKHHSVLLQRAWDKYGADSFEFVVIEYCPPEDCLTHEQAWMDHYQSCDPRSGYNLCPTAGNTKGARLSDEHRAKIREKMKARKLSEEHKARIGAAHRGKRLSEEARKKISEKAKCRPPVSDEARAKRAAVMRRLIGEGLFFSKEHRARISRAIKARGPLSAETRAKVSATKRAALGLTREEAGMIRASYSPKDPSNGQTALARKFGVSRTAIRNIVTGVTWNDARLTPAGS